MTKLCLRIQIKPLNIMSAVLLELGSYETIALEEWVAVISKQQSLSVLNYICRTWERWTERSDWISRINDIRPHYDKWELAASSDVCVACRGTMQDACTDLFSLRRSHNRCVIPASVLIRGSTTSLLRTAWLLHCENHCRRLITLLCISRL